MAGAVEEGARGQGESRTGASRGTGLWGKTPSVGAQLHGMTGRLRGVQEPRVSKARGNGTRGRARLRAQLGLPPCGGRSRLEHHRTLGDTGEPGQVTCQKPGGESA